ncbi:hypothetical protein ACWDAZ_33205, partial [Streptomyces sp. NPDC001215]
MPRKSTRLTFAVLATGAGVFSMLQSLIAPALQTVQHALHTSQSTATWVMTAYLLSASARGDQGRRTPRSTGPVRLDRGRVRPGQGAAPA